MNRREFMALPAVAMATREPFGAPPLDPGILSHRRAAYPNAIAARLPCGASGIVAGWRGSPFSSARWRGNIYYSEGR